MGSLKNKLGYAFMLPGICFLGNAMAVTFTATDTITGTVNCTVRGLTGGGETDAFNLSSFRLLTPPQTIVRQITAQGPSSSATLTAPGSASMTVTGITVVSQGSSSQPKIELGYIGSDLVFSKQFNGLVRPTAASSSYGLNYSGFGLWLRTPVPPAAGQSATVQKTIQQYAGGSQLTTSMPTSGTAAYKGKIEAAVIKGTVPYTMLGNLALTANFGTHAIAGNATGMTVMNSNTNTAAGKFNNLHFVAGITGNSFSGRVTTLTTAGVAVGAANPLALAAGVTGSTQGHFYGPTANEITGVFGFTAGGGRAMSGAFGAKR